MKRPFFFISCALVLAAEIVALVVFALQTPETAQDTVAVNEILQTVTRDFHALEEHKNATALDYVVVDTNGNIVYKTKSGLSESVNAAIMHRDTILDVASDNTVVGKIIVYNDGAQTFRAQRRGICIVLAVAVAVQGAVFAAYAVYVHRRVVAPFTGLKGFAERVAGGNLDIPLAMDRHNLFGAFTESFDIMRAELKKARLSEAQAEQSKKELVAKLSHDIKTPIASIKAVAEVGQAVAERKKDKENYTQIIGKADQIAALVTDLFTATLEELQQLTVSPTNTESTPIKIMLENADYLHKATIPAIPECLIHADVLSLQQVFDNIFANSYKYANTAITVTTEKTDTHMRVIIEDSGGGVLPDELPALKEKYKRGKNAENIEGAGLGLYISDYFMKEMQGALTIENGEHGLKATVTLVLSGKI